MWCAMYIFFYSPPLNGTFRAVKDLRLNSVMCGCSCIYPVHNFLVVGKIAAVGVGSMNCAAICVKTARCGLVR
jgi:hypothetical protein